MSDFPFYGTVSHGTMQPDHLIPVFLETLYQVSPTEHRKLLNEYEDADLESAWNNRSFELWNHNNDEYLLESLFDVLHELAPPNYYFGAHLEDGSDYGYWPCDDNWVDCDSEISELLYD